MIQDLRYGHGAFADVYHQPGVGLPGGAHRISEVGPALVSIADDMFARADFDSQRHIGVLSQDPNSAVRVGITPRSQLADIVRNETDTGQVHQTENLGLDAVDILPPEGPEIARTGGSRVQHRGHAPRGA